MADMLPVIEQEVEGTSTLALARELHRSSWVHNQGRTIHDIPLFDALDEVSKFHLLETAAAAEALLEVYDQEEEKLLTWNLAECVYRAYVGHPAGGESTPNLPWRTMPNDLKLLYYRYAQDMLQEWYLKKHLPRHRGWMKIEVQR